jgi:hypothetical protein
MSLACRSEVGRGGRGFLIGRVEAEGPLEVAVEVDTLEILALLLRFVLAVLEAISQSSLMIPRSENDGRGLEVESTKPNYQSAEI